jgi:hypothetical protein
MIQTDKTGNGVIPITFRENLGEDREVIVYVHNDFVSQYITIKQEKALDYNKADTYTVTLNGDEQGSAIDIPYEYTQLRVTGQVLVIKGDDVKNEEKPASGVTVTYNVINHDSVVSSTSGTLVTDTYGNFYLDIAIEENVSEEDIKVIIVFTIKNQVKVLEITQASAPTAP